MKNNTKTIEKLLLYCASLMTTSVLVSCGGGGSSSPSPSPVVSGAPSAVYRLAAGTITGCASGGINVYSGIDSNLNGVLDANEITSTQTVCNGSSGINTLVSTTVEPAGSNCALGGTKLTAGLDASGNGLLIASNVTSTAYICNGAAGSTGATGATGAAGTSGTNGANGANGGTNGTNGTSGTNGTNGSNGSNGTNGLNSLTTIAVESAGTHCASGGSKVTTGLDTNSSGVLDTGEITATAYICHGVTGSSGANGATGAAGSTGATGANGAAGASGAAGAIGTNGTNGLPSLMTVAAESAGAHCASGGSKVTTGLDTNGNAVLDAGEITATAYICNGATGATGAAGAAGANGTNGTNGSNGSNGTSGSNGVNSLVAIVPETAGANCTYGGRSITSGLDLNSNTVLDVGEVSSTSYVCNGAVGATGPQGPAGPGVTWVNVTGTAVTAVANQGYVASAATQVTITLPDSSALAVGDIIQVVGGGAGGWKIAQNTGQIIFTSNVKNGATTNNFFTPHATQRNWSAVASSYDGTKLVATESGGLIYTSSDSGASWASHESVRNWSAVASSYDGAKLVATESGGLIYTSSDSGASWASHGEARYWKSVASSYDGTKLVAVSGALSAAPGIYRSSDSGITWTGAGPNNKSWTSVASSSDGTKLIASIVGNGGYSISTDSGANWSAANPVGYVNSVASSADGTKLAYITQSGPGTLSQLSTSVDSGLSFVNQNGYTASQNFNQTFLASSLDGKNLITVNNGGIVKTSIDSGVSWTDTEFTQWYFQKENNANYTSVASSADGTKVVFAGDEGTFIYTSSAATSLGTSGSITGQGYDSIELIYIGTGQFRVVFPVNYLLVN